ncbi:similar to Saccharomyces cerevisiae YMR277W FCP1 Carboxy-terminal domain (CTD) phosphatase [Maudiozyma saulgeensis]|uniref:RNA polymerase II subunit A C-terminal domain phosphatase n=1 Tax=Maudiozyma saulgeensis TaxID=1789683 RepID=A0A1X7R8M7_9SACH|nr:similar to Saccharomyces cerevisiae YMR277W FCP1 Carboxy-terminal domain (CTD) phosphatase [Kazachstania saulgeensis]
MTAPTPVNTREGLPYPITVDQLIADVGDDISKGDRLFAYKFWYIVEMANSPDDNDSAETTKKSVRESIEFFESPFEGKLHCWNVEVGMEIASPNQTVCQIVRPCNHDIVYGGLCTMCGKEVDEAEQLAIGGANLAISHTDLNLKISRKAASDIGHDIKKRLRNDKKLVLVVDLDQTVIHCGVDPTIGEWKRDPTNPNYETLKDVRIFSLEEEPIVPFMYMGPKPPLRKCWYYVKIRPGLKEFFAKIAPFYEMHIYTMATRAYALEIAKIIDPDHSLFGDRILSRDENGSMTQKSLERLFPSDQSMVVIIDDRGDVWNWSPNLIKVTPYNFFVGVGDINSNFLPKQQSTMLQMGRRSRTKVKESDDLLTDIIDTEKILKEKIDEEVKRQEEELSHQEGPRNEEKQSTETKEEWTKKLEYSASLEVQQKNRPLATLQEHLQNQKLLIDDDDELFHLKDTLVRIHSTFYDKLEESPNNDAMVDIKYILPDMEKKVFDGCHFVFSGLIPLNTDVQKADIVIWTNKFGGTTEIDIDENTTHVVTKTPGTYKARLAKSYNPKIEVVHPDWIFESLSSWKRVDEAPYRLIVDQPVSPEDVEQFKEKLERLRREREVQHTAKDEEEYDEFAEDSKPPNPADLFANGDSWLNDEDEEIPSDEDDDDENENKSETTSEIRGNKRAVPEDGDDAAATKKPHVVDAEDEVSDSDSDMDEELLNMLDS